MPAACEERGRVTCFAADDEIPVPKWVGPGGAYREPGRYITLTTCTPVYTSRYRMAVWGSLVRVDPVDANRTPPPELRTAA